jgi:glyoxylase-like metal-dependent hydrolase (beta-lactamase superfamily II)
MKSGETPHPPATAEFGAVVQGGPPHRYPPHGDVLVTKFSVGPFDNNVYVVASKGEAIIVDGAAEPDRILAECQGLAVRAIVQTHNHPDHTAALASLVSALGVPVLAHPGDPMPVATEPAEEGRIQVGESAVQAIYTPGHTPGSTCYLIGPFLFSGDTLFPGGPGNTGGAGQFTEIMRSLDRLFRLPDDTRILPGHGRDTTIGRERPFVEAWRARGW